MGYSGFVVSSILRMDFNGSVRLGHVNLAIVIGQDSKLDDFTVETSETFQTELSSVEYFNLWTVDA